MGRQSSSVAVLLLLHGPLTAEEPRIAPVATSCPEDAASPRVDAVGVSDACVQEAAPFCAPELWLREDLEKDEDRCVRARGGRRHSRAVSSVGPPSCPAPLERAVRKGPDVCQRLVPPSCPRDFRLEARPGEDRCVPGEEKKPDEEKKG